MLGIEEETLVKVVENREDYDREIPLDRPKLRLVTRLKKTNHTIAERKPEDQQYDRQPGHAHLEHDVQKSILGLGQKPGNSENNAIGFALKAKPESLVSITKQRALGDRIEDRAPNLGASGQGHVFAKQSE